MCLGGKIYKKYGYIKYIFVISNPGQTFFFIVHETLIKIKNYEIPKKDLYGFLKVAIYKHLFINRTNTDIDVLINDNNKI